MTDRPDTPRMDVEKSSYHHLSQNEMVTIIVAGNSSTFHARNEKF
jgi:hypothetical protein